MYNEIRISIIIPNYNHAAYLKQRIDSVLSQTFQDFELIILDDFSTDSSRDLIEQYIDHPKIAQIIFNNENSGGVFKQWIKGIENAKGEYIWIAESDDYAAEDFLEETLRVIEKDTLIGMVFTNTTVVNSKGDYLGTTEADESLRFDLLTNCHNIINRENAPQFLISKMIIANASSVLFRKTNLLAIDFKELQKFSNTGDRFVYLGIALKSKIVYIPKLLNFMRSHENNTTKKSFENGNIHKDRLRVLNYYSNSFCENQSTKKEIVAFYKENYLFFINYSDYDKNLKLLKNVYDNGKLGKIFYYSVRYYLFLFKKLDLKIRVLRSLYYRFLLLQK